MDKGMKKYFIAYLMSVFFSTQLWAAATPTDYPHWDWQNSEEIAKLKKIDAFIKANQHKNAIAVFDWDGTVYDETIRTREAVGGNVIKSGQAVWHIWAANHAFHQDYASLNLFPHYHDCASPCVLESLINKDDYLEGLTPNQLPMDNYSKFSQIAVIEAGMTPDAFTRGVEAYETHYPVTRFAFLPMFDVIQQMINHNFKVWFISGSNPYFIATLLKKIETIDPRYDFSSIIGTGDPVLTDETRYRIIGNHAKLYQGKFTRVYDDRYLQRTRTEPLNAIFGEGKAIAIRRYILKRDQGKLMFAAGNSSGDIEMMAEVIQNPHSLLVGINPADKLKAFLARQPAAQVITLAMPEDQE
jgi:phosphoserine phosphatase